MALVNCRECGTSVSSKARSCPHCGISKPARSKAELALPAVGLVAGLLAIAMCSGKPTTVGTDANPSDAEWLLQYGGDPKALDDRFSDKAQAACSVGADDFLRSIAAHDFAWDSETDGWLGVKFNKFGTHSAGSGLLTLISDRAKLSNGFGAFTHINLYCLYDAKSGKVVRFSQSDPASDVPSEHEAAADFPAKKSAPLVVWKATGDAPAESGTESPTSDPPAPLGGDRAPETQSIEWFPVVTVSLRGEPMHPPALDAIPRYTYNSRAVCMAATRRDVQDMAKAGVRGRFMCMYHNQPDAELKQAPKEDF